MELFKEIKDQVSINDLFNDYLSLQSDISFVSEKRFIETFCNYMTVGNYKTEDVKNILDIGCGNGHHTLKLTEIFPNANVIGIDNNENLIDTALKNKKTQNVNYVLENFTKPKNPKYFDSLDSSFDAVHMRLILANNNHENILTIIHNARKMLKKNGVLFIVEPNDSVWEIYPKNDFLTRVINVIRFQSENISCERSVAQQLPKLLPSLGFHNFYCEPSGQIASITKKYIKAYKILSKIAHLLAPDLFTHVELEHAFKELDKLINNKYAYASIPISKIAVQKD